jgi:plastocyanin
MLTILLAAQRSIAHPQGRALARIIMRPLAATLGVVLIGAVGAGAPFSSTAVAAATDASIVIHIKNFAFDPGTLSVKSGQRVTWVNDDPVPHTATNAAKVWDSGQLQPRATFNTIFTMPGVYLYNCTVHPFMEAKIIVSP